jgi:hypothetical protein
MLGGGYRKLLEAIGTSAIGAEEIFVAVPPDRDDEPVRRKAEAEWPV